MKLCLLNISFLTIKDPLHDSNNSIRHVFWTRKSEKKRVESIQSVNYYLYSIFQIIFCQSYLSCGLFGPNFIPQVRFTEHAQTPAILPVQLESGNSVIRLPSQQDYRNTTQHSTTFPAVILLLLIKILANCTWMFGHKIPNMIKPPKVANNFLHFLLRSFFPFWPFRSRSKLRCEKLSRLPHLQIPHTINGQGVLAGRRLSNVQFPPKFGETISYHSTSHLTWKKYVEQKTRWLWRFFFLGSISWIGKKLRELRDIFTLWNLV